MFVHGKAEKGDADKLKERLVPAIKTVVLRSPTGMDWDIATALGKQIEKAEVTTVVHGGCYELVCPAMFLSGKQRLFSGTSRLETHWVSLYIGENTFVLKDTTTKLSDIHAWWQNHTKLSGRDVSVYRESFFSVLPNSAPMDRKVFFPIQAKYQNGNVIHCSGAAKSQQFIDCMPVPDASALSKGIITSADLFTDPRLKEPQDTPAPAPTGFAKLDAIDAVPVGDNCKEIYKDFLKQPSPRAFYVNDSKGCGWQNAQSFTPNKSALSRCKQARPNGECRLYAVDDQVVFTPFDKPLPTAADVVLP
ncbi:MAG: X-Pro dipeptidyl-peptidase family protein [Proteobacteria bacterium]|nr:X-Pro dipeptidyl-peptidase family protein [Pseudomonadota bacterium]